MAARCPTSPLRRLAAGIALFAVPKAEEPADASHPYGHEKVESMAAAIEGMLILVGAGIIVYASTRKLMEGSHVAKLGLAIGVIGFSSVANLGVSGFLRRQARLTDSPAL